MPSRLTIVMYHYVRELPLTRYPRIRGLLESEFVGQLDHMQRHYTFVSDREVLDAAHGGKPLPDNAALLTFDDGYLDHFVTAFPVLHARAIPACFFPPAVAILERKLLDVNKIHFAIASAPSEEHIVEAVKAGLDALRAEYGLDTTERYWRHLAQPGRFDSAGIVFVKRLLQAELPPEARALLAARIFDDLVGVPEAVFASELYMSASQVRTLVKHGMCVGSHGCKHAWLTRLSPAEQAEEIDGGLAFLNLVGARTRDWVLAYPYGDYDTQVEALVAHRGCAMAVTTEVDIARVSGPEMLHLPRLDTNDLAKRGDGPPTDWTRAAAGAS